MGDEGFWATMGVIGFVIFLIWFIPSLLKYLADQVDCVKCRKVFQAKGIYPDAWDCEMCHKEKERQQG